MMLKTRSHRGRRAIALAAVIALSLPALAGCGALMSGSDPVATDGVVRNGYASDEAAKLAEQEMAGAEQIGAPTVAPAPGSGYDASGVPAADRLVIRNQTLRIEVEAVAKAVDDIRAAAGKHSAIITDLQVASDDDGYLYRYDEYGATASDGAALRGWVTVRVPAASLTAFVDAVTALGTVKYQAEASEDVTQQHVDLSARLENLRANETRLREFFDAAKKVDEMLSIERELSRVRGEIEAMEAQVAYLERQAAMATVTVELSEPRPIVRPEGVDWGFGDAITNGFRGAAGVIQLVIAFVIATAPLWLFGLVLFFIIRAVVRRRKARFAEQTPVPDVPTPPDA
jgi:hypothetical protein